MFGLIPFYLSDLPIPVVAVAADIANAFQFNYYINKPK